MPNITPFVPYIYVPSSNFNFGDEGQEPSVPTTDETSDELANLQETSDELANLQTGIDLTNSSYRTPEEKAEMLGNQIASTSMQDATPFSITPNSTQELIGGLQYAEVEKQKAIKLDEPKWEEFKKLKAEGKSPTTPWGDRFTLPPIDVEFPDKTDPTRIASGRFDLVNEKDSTSITPEQTTFTPAQRKQYDAWKSKYPNLISLSPKTDAEKEKEHALSQLAKKQPFADAATKAKSKLESSKRAVRKQYNLDGTLRPDNLRYSKSGDGSNEVNVPLDVLGGKSFFGGEVPLDVFGKKIEGFPVQLVPSQLPETYKEAELLLEKIYKQTLDGIKSAARAEGITSGIIDAAIGLVSPENITLMVATGFASAPMKVTISAYFSITMGIGAYEATNAALEARERGDVQDEAYLWTSAVFSTIMAVFAGKHALAKKSTSFKLESPEVRAEFPSQTLISVFNKELRNDKGLPYVLDFETAAKVENELIDRGFTISSRPTKQSMFFPDTRTTEGFVDMKEVRNSLRLSLENVASSAPLTEQAAAKENQEKLIAEAIPQLVETAAPISAQSLMDSFKINHLQARVLMGFARVSGLDLNKILVSTYEKMDAAGLSPVVGANRGFFIPLDQARAIISGLTNSSWHTGIHEVLHAVRRQIVSRDYSGSYEYRLSLPEILALEEWAGAKDGVWSPSAEEKFSNSFTRYLADNDSVSVEMKGIFGKIKKYLSSIYNEIKSYVEVSDEIKSIFDKIANKELRKESNVASRDAMISGTKNAEKVAGSLKKGDTITIADGTVILVEEDAIGEGQPIKASINGKSITYEDGLGWAVMEQDATSKPQSDSSATSAPSKVSEAIAPPVALAQGAAPKDLTKEEEKPLVVVEKKLTASQRRSAAKKVEDAAIFAVSQAERDKKAEAIIASLANDPFPTTIEAFLGPNPSFAKGSQKSIEDIGKMLQRLARERLGGPIDVKTMSPSEKVLVATIMKRELIFNKNRSGNAFDWYTGNIDDMLKISGLLYPELGKDFAGKIKGFEKSESQFNDANFVYRLVFAITSQNLKVVDNTDWALLQYEYFRKNGKFDPSVDIGSKAESIAGNLKLANDLIEKIGIVELKKFCESTLKKSEALDWLQAKLGKKVSISGGKKGDTILGSAIFGPKIGEGFLSNLMGNYYPITVDLWLRRTWGRWTGNSVGKGVNAENLGRFLDAARDEQSVAEPSRISNIPVEDKARKSNGNRYRAVSDSEITKILADKEFEDAIINYAKLVQSEWQRQYRFIRMPVSQAQLAGIESGVITIDKIVRDAETAYALASKIAGGKPFTKSEAKGFLADDYVPDGFTLNSNGTFEPIKGHNFKLVKESEIKKLKAQEIEDSLQDQGIDSDGIIGNEPPLTGSTVKELSLRVRAFKVMKRDFGFDAKITNKTVSSLIKTDSALSSQSLINSYKITDVPSDADRAAIKDVFEILHEMLEKDKIKITNADTQALHWYPEKDLFAFLLGKEHELNLSYRDAMLAVAIKRGLGEEARKLLNENKPPTTPTNDKPKLQTTIQGTEPAAKESTNGGRRTDQSGASNAVTDTGTESGVRSGDAEKVKEATRPIVEEIQKILTDAIAKGGKVTAKAKQTIRDLVTAKFLPKITPTEKLIADLPSQETVSGAIEENQRKRASTLDAFDLKRELTLRQDVKAWTRNGVGVVTARQEAIDGTVTHAYVPMAIIENVVFDTNQKGILQTAAGGHKRSNLATARGMLSASQDIPADIETWTQVGFNPDRHTYFYPKADHTQVVLSGDAAMQIGNTVFVKNPVYATKAEAAKFLFQEAEGFSRGDIENISGVQKALISKRFVEFGIPEWTFTAHPKFDEITEAAARMFQSRTSGGINNGKSFVYENAVLADRGDNSYLSAVHSISYLMLINSLERQSKKPSKSVLEKIALLKRVIIKGGTLAGARLNAQKILVDSVTGQRIKPPKETESEGGKISNDDIIDFIEEEVSRYEEVRTAQIKATKHRDQIKNAEAAGVVDLETRPPETEPTKPARKKSEVKNDFLEVANVATSILKSLFSVKAAGLSQLPRITKQHLDIFAKALAYYAQKDFVDFKDFLDKFLSDNQMPEDLLSEKHQKYIHDTAYLYFEDIVNNEKGKLLDEMTSGSASTSSEAKVAVSPTAKVAKAAKVAATAKVEETAKKSSTSTEVGGAFDKVYGLERFEKLTQAEKDLVLEQFDNGYSWAETETLNDEGIPQEFQPSDWRMTTPEMADIVRHHRNLITDKQSLLREELRLATVINSRGNFTKHKNFAEGKRASDLALRSISGSILGHLFKDQIKKSNGHFVQLIEMVENELAEVQSHTNNIYAQIQKANEYLGADQFKITSTSEYFVEERMRYRKGGITTKDFEEIKNNSLFFLQKAGLSQELAVELIALLEVDFSPKNALQSVANKIVESKSPKAAEEPVAVPTDTAPLAEKVKEKKEKVKKTSEEKRAILIKDAVASAKVAVEKARASGGNPSLIEIEALIDQRMVFEYVRVEVEKDVSKEWTKENIMPLFDYVAKILNNEVLEPAGYFGGITGEQARDIYTQHGKVTYPSTEPLNVSLAQLRAIGDLRAKWEEAMRGEIPKATGKRRIEQTVEMRKLTKEISVLMRSLQFSDENIDGFLRSAKQKRIKTLQNKIEDIKDQIAQGKRRENAPSVPWTADELALKAEIAKLNDELDVKLGEQDTEELQRIYDRIDRQLAILNSGNLFKPKAKPSAKSAAVAEALANLKDVNEKLANARKEQRLIENPPKTPEQASIDRLTKILSILQKENELGVYIMESNDYRVNSEEIQALRDAIKYEQDKKKEAKAAMRKASEPYISPDDIEISALTDQIAKVEDMLATGNIDSKPVAGKRVTSSDAVLALRSHLDSLRSDLSDAREAKKLKYNPAKTEEEIRIDTLDRLIATRKEQIESGDFLPTAQPTRMITDRIKAREVILDSLNKQIFKLRKAERLRTNPPLTKSQILIKAIDKRIASIERQIDSGVLSAPRELSKNTDPEVLRKRKLLQEAKANLDAMFGISENAESLKLREEIKRLSADILGYRPKPRVSKSKSQEIQDLIEEKKAIQKSRMEAWKASPEFEEYNLNQFIKQKEKKLEEIERRIAASDFSPFSKKKIPTSDRKLQALLDLEFDKKLNNYKRLEKKKEYMDMNSFQKTVYWTNYISHEMLMASFTVVPKLVTTAGISSLIVSPTAELFGYLNTKVFPSLKNADIETAQTFNELIQGEYKAITNAFLFLGDDLVSTWTLGKPTYEFEVAGGRSDYHTAYVARFHGLMKVIPSRQAYERTVFRLLAELQRKYPNPADIPTERLKMVEIEIKAVLKAQQAKFQEENPVSKWVSGTATALADGNKNTEAVVKILTKAEMPVVTVSMNLYKSFIEMQYGAPVALTRLTYHSYEVWKNNTFGDKASADWFERSYQDMDAKTANAIQKQLKAGEVGIAIGLIAYFLWQKRKKEEGHNVPDKLGPFFDEEEIAKEVLKIELNKVFVESPALHLALFWSQIFDQTERLMAEDKSLSDLPDFLNKYADIEIQHFSMNPIGQTIKSGGLILNPKTRQRELGNKTKTMLGLTGPMRLIANALDPISEDRTLLDKFFLGILGKGATPRKGTEYWETVKEGIPFLRNTVTRNEKAYADQMIVDEERTKHYLPWERKIWHPTK